MRGSKVGRHREALSMLNGVTMPPNSGMNYLGYRPIAGSGIAPACGASPFLVFVVYDW